MVDETLNVRADFCYEPKHRMDNMTDFQILSSMTDLQILDLIRNDMKKVQSDMKKVQGLLDNALTSSKKIASLRDELAQSSPPEERVLDLLEHEEPSIVLNGIVEDGLSYVDSDVVKSSCDESPCDLGVEDPLDIIDGCSDSCIDEEQLDVMGIESTVVVISVPLEVYDPFWSAMLDSGVEAQLRFLLLKMVFTSSSDMIFDLADNPSLHHSDGGYFIMSWTLMRDYDGFNGPGTSQVAFTFRWSLVRDYDGFNGPGHTLRTRCL